MSVPQVSFAGLLVLALVAWALDGVGDPDVWAGAFWCSALANYVLAVALAGTRSARAPRLGSALASTWGACHPQLTNPI